MFDGKNGSGQISLCMIVRDEAASIERAIQSVRSLVHEIIVVDTGSQDATRQIAARLGATLFDFPWIDDFAAARNYSLKQASSEWILVLDADEVIAAKDHPKILQIIRTSRYDGIYFYQRNYFEDPSAENWCVNKTDYEEAKPYAGYSDVLALRLFKNAPHIYYEGIVHESVDYSLEKKRKHYSDIPIHHFRRDSFRQDAVKKEKYLKLLLKEYESNPMSVKTCFLLGRQYYNLERYPEAIAYLEQGIECGTRSEIVYENLASAYYQCGMFAETITTLEKVLEFNPRYAEAYATIALAYYETGVVAKAVNSLVQAIHLRPASVRYYYNLAAIFYRERDLDASENYLRQAIRLSTKFPRSFYLLFFILFEKKRNDEALEVARILERADPKLFEYIRQKVTQLQGNPFPTVSG